MVTTVSPAHTSPQGSSVAVERPSGALHDVARPRQFGIKGRPDMVAVGTIVWLASELMFFAALFAAYFNTRSFIGNAQPETWRHGTDQLNVPYALVFTTILVLSSVTCQMGVLAAEHGYVKRRGSLFNPLKWGMREWYILTFIMGAVFIAGQITEYATLLTEYAHSAGADGFTIYSSPYGSVFFLATGFHGLHVLGGLVAFLLVLGRTFLARRFTHEQAVNAVVVSYYWHFVDVIWIVLFFVIYWLR